jgi:hypothetical protein
MPEDPSTEQQAIGSHIAQADRGSIAVVGDDNIVIGGFGVAPLTLKKIVMAELISVVSLMLSLWVSQFFVPLTASFDEVILYAGICAIAFTGPCYLLSRIIKDHVHMGIATFGNLILLVVIWLLIRL